MQYLANLAERANPWRLLFIISALVFASALYFQFVMDLQPCVKCVYQRVAILGVAAAGLIGSFTYQYGLGRLIAFALWLYSSYQGAVIAYQHWQLQETENPLFAVCESIPNFPDWAPLHQWLPTIFKPQGLCGDVHWSFVDMTMPQWTTVIFSLAFAVGTVLLVIRLAKKHQI